MMREMELSVELRAEKKNEKKSEQKCTHRNQKRKGACTQTDIRAIAVPLVINIHRENSKRRQNMIMLFSRNREKKKLVPTAKETKKEKKKNVSERNISSAFRSHFPLDAHISFYISIVRTSIVFSTHFVSLLLYFSLCLSDDQRQQQF